MSLSASLLESINYFFFQIEKMSSRPSEKFLDRKDFFPLFSEKKFKFEQPKKKSQVVQAVAFFILG